MSEEVTIYDYLDHAGANLFSQWMDGIGKRPKAKINSMLYILAAVPLEHWHEYKYTENLRGENDLWTIKAFVEDVQWRPIGIMGPGEKTFTLLVGANERQRRLEPASAIATAHARKANVRSNPDQHRRAHAYR